jgi:hypothetical protein
MAASTHRAGLVSLEEPRFFQAKRLVPQKKMKQDQVRAFGITRILLRYIPAAQIARI